MPKTVLKWLLKCLKSVKNISKAVLGCKMVQNDKLAKTKNSFLISPFVMKISKAGRFWALFGYWNLWIRNCVWKRPFSALKWSKTTNLKNRKFRFWFHPFWWIYPNLAHFGHFLGIEIAGSEIEVAFSKHKISKLLMSESCNELKQQLIVSFYRYRIDIRCTVSLLAGVMY